MCTSTRRRVRLERGLACRMGLPSVASPRITDALDRNISSLKTGARLWDGLDVGVVSEEADPGGSASGIPVGFGVGSSGKQTPEFSVNLPLLLLGLVPIPSRLRGVRTCTRGRSTAITKQKWSGSDGHSGSDLRICRTRFVAIAGLVFTVRRTAYSP